MASKRLLFRSAAREKILSGATALADAVRITLGPKSKCVLIQKKWGKPIVCNDGITIAKEIELEDPEANLGAQMIREAAERTGDAKTWSFTQKSGHTFVGPTETLTFQLDI